MALSQESYVDLLVIEVFKYHYVGGMQGPGMLWAVCAEGMESGHWG